jgi:uncharacterized protein YjdB
LAKNACAGYYAKALSGGFPPVWEPDAQMDWTTPTYPAQLLNFDQASPAKATTSHRSGDIVTICGTGDGFGEVSVYPETFYIDVGNAAKTVAINGPATLRDVDPPNSDYTAWVTDPYGKAGDRTKKATWTSSNPAVASIDANGAVVPHKKGTFTLTGTVYGKSGQGTVTVVGPTSVTISPSNPAVDETKTIPLTATSHYADGYQTTAKPASWSSADQAIATVNSSTGVVTGVHFGQTTITATVDGTITGSVTVSVTGGQISGYYVTGLSGAPQPITSDGTYSLTPTTTTTTPFQQPVTYKWEVTYSNGIRPNQTTGFQSGAYALQAPAGNYTITVTVTPRQYFGTGYPSAFRYPVCTTGAQPAAAQLGAAVAMSPKLPGTQPGVVPQVVFGCGKQPA